MSETLADQIAGRMKARNLNVNQVAKGSGISNASVKNYQTGATYPGVEILKKLCEFLGIKSPAPKGEKRRRLASHNMAAEVESELKRLGWTIARMVRESGVAYETIKKARDGHLIADRTATKIKSAFEAGSTEPEKIKLPEPRPESAHKKRRMSRKQIAAEIEGAVNLVIDSDDPMWMIVIQPHPEGLDVRACSRPKQEKIQLPKDSENPMDSLHR